MKLIVALHGFLGLPEDWNFLKNQFSETELWAPNLWKDFDLGPQLSMQQFGGQLILKSEQKYPHIQERFLLGYSLGGRLALHSLQARPQFWRKSIFISTHPGLTDAEQKEQRLRDDEIWARRFETAPWAEVLESWNRQGVFQNQHQELQRHKDDYDRTKLAQSLRSWSLGKRDDFRSFLHEPWPYLWLVGERGSKFCNLAQPLPATKCRIVKEAAHRLPFEAPQTLLEILKTELSRV